MLVYRNDAIRIHSLGLLRANSYLVQYEGVNLLVDTGIAWEYKRLLKSLQKRGVESLDAIFLTHVHTDHVGNAASLGALFACPVYVHPAGLNALAEGRCEMPRGTTLGGRAVAGVVGASPRLWKTFTPCPGALGFEEMQPSSLCGQGSYILETRGHTPDSASLIIPAPGGRGGAALVGDAMVHSSPGRIWPPFADEAEEVQASWRRLLGTGCTVFLPGHGRPVNAELLREGVAQHVPAMGAGAINCISRYK